MTKQFFFSIFLNSITLFIYIHPFDTLLLQEQIYYTTLSVSLLASWGIPNRIDSLSRKLLTRLDFSISISPMIIFSNACLFNEPFRHNGIDCPFFPPFSNSSTSPTTTKFRNECNLTPIWAVADRWTSPIVKNNTKISDFSTCSLFKYTTQKFTKHQSLLIFS